MYIIGHYITTKNTNLFSKNILNNSSGIALYLPDFASCHDWGYQNCFSMNIDTESQALIKAHMLGDWWVHCGPHPIRSRRGWAYKRMSFFASKYELFFKEASEKNLLLEINSLDSIRGFSHTMMEYSIDTYLSRKLDHSEFLNIKNIFKDLGNKDSCWSSNDIKKKLKYWKIDSNIDNLQKDIDSFKKRVLISNSASEMAYRAGIKKFNLIDTPESISFIANFINDGLQQLNPNELDEVTENITNFIKKNL